MRVVCSTTAYRTTVPPSRLDSLEQVRSAAQTTTSASAGKDKPRGVTFVRSSGRWRAHIIVNGERISLGEHADAQTASDAYEAARAVYRDKQYMAQRSRKRPRAAAASSTAVSTSASNVVVDAGAVAEGTSAAAEAAHASSSSPATTATTTASKYLGVFREAGCERWEAVLQTDGREIHGGEYDSEADAARAYDALARMYVGSDARTNFPVDPYAAWVPPDDVVHTGQIETKVGVPLTVDEIAGALRQERGVDVSVLPLAGHSDLAEHMVFATGRSPPHMRKMADTISRALRKRRLPGIDATVEARDMDDWMVVDAGNVIVNIMASDARAAFDLENFYKGLKQGEDPYAGMTFDEWLEANPVPDVWLARLQRDEEELRRMEPLPPPKSTLVDSVGPTFGKRREERSGVRGQRNRGSR